MLLKGQESQFCFVLFSLGFFVVCLFDFLITVTVALLS